MQNQNQTVPQILNIVINVALLNSNGLSLVGIANDSTVIVLGSVTSLRSAYNDSGTGIFTYVTVAVNRILKGTNTSSSLVVRIPGGTVGNISQVVSDLGSFFVGETVVLFLEGPDSDNQYTLPAAALGIFRVLSDPLKGQVAVIDPSYKHLDLIQPLDPAFVTLLNNSEGNALSLDELITALGNTH